MCRKDELTITDLVQLAPARTMLFTALPLALASSQFLNWLYTDLPLWTAAAFAAVMIVSAIALTGHTRAEVRLAELERELDAPVAD